MLLAAAAAVVSSLLLSSLTAIDTVPTWIVVLLFGIAGLTVWRPDLGLLVLAAGVPVASWVGRFWDDTVAWPETLAIAFIAGWFVRAAVRAPARRDDELFAPVSVVAAVVLGSLMVQLLADRERLGPELFGQRLWLFMGADYFQAKRSFLEFDATGRLVESLVVLYAAGRITRRTPAFGLTLAKSLVIGGAAAAALTGYRLWLAASRLESPLQEFIRYFATIRLNVHYGDLNAAGSYFALVLFVSASLFVVTRSLRWGAAMLLVGAGLWMSGSRAAFAASLIATAVPVWSWLRSSHGNRARAYVTVYLLAMVTMGVVASYYLPKRGNQQGPPAAVRIRTELARTSVRMLSDEPAFGIGIGQFYQRSGEFSSPEFLNLFPPARNENAHNNFLQIVAELGIVGLLAFAWLLAVAARRIARLLSASKEGPLRWGLSAGLLAFGLTCLAGHPLLIDEPAFLFWIVLGLAVGLSVGTAAPRTTAVRITPWYIPVAVSIAIAVSVPLRAASMVRGLNLEHIGIGLSAWEAGPEGVRCRLAGAVSTVFLPANAHQVIIPLRAIPNGAGLRVALSLDRRPANVVVVPADRWHYLRFPLPVEPHAPRFRRLDLTVLEPPSDTAPVLMVGKVEPR